MISAPDIFIIFLMTSFSGFPAGSGGRRVGGTNKNPRRALRRRGLLNLVWVYFRLIPLRREGVNDAYNDNDGTAGRNNGGVVV